MDETEIISVCYKPKVVKFLYSSTKNASVLNSLECLSLSVWFDWRQWQYPSPGLNLWLHIFNGPVTSWIRLEKNCMHGQYCSLAWTTSTAFLSFKIKVVVFSNNSFIFFSEFLGHPNSNTLKGLDAKRLSNSLSIKLIFRRSS